MNIKNIIIPVGFNAEQCQEGIMAHFEENKFVEWKEQHDFVEQYLYCQNDGNYDLPLKVWLVVYDAPSKIIKKNKDKCPSLYINCKTIGINLRRCKAHHKGLSVEVIRVLPILLGHPPVDIPEKWFGNVVDNFHTLNLEEERLNADGEMPFVEFLNNVDTKIASIIKENLC